MTSMTMINDGTSTSSIKLYCMVIFHGTTTVDVLCMYVIQSLIVTKK